MCSRHNTGIRYSELETLLPHDKKWTLMNSKQCYAVVCTYCVIPKARSLLRFTVRLVVRLIILSDWKAEKDEGYPVNLGTTSLK